MQAFLGELVFHSSKRNSPINACVGGYIDPYGKWRLSNYFLFIVIINIVIIIIIIITIIIIVIIVIIIIENRPIKILSGTHTFRISRCRRHLVSHLHA